METWPTSVRRTGHRLLVLALALIALAGAGFVSIGLSLLGAYAVIPNFGDWGWLIGAALGAALYTTLMRREAPSLSRSDRVVA